MKFPTTIFSLLALTLMVGISVGARAEEQDNFPVQRQIESRQVAATHSLRCVNTCEAARRDGRDDKMAMPAEETIAPPVHFAPRSTALTPKAEAEIRKIAALLKSPAYANRHVTVGGYTDNKGKSSANQRLSFHRASNVVKHLVKLGVPSSQLTAQGFGADKPVADNGTGQGRAQNRRVTFTSQAVMVKK